MYWCHFHNYIVQKCLKNGGRTNFKGIGMGGGVREREGSCFVLVFISIGFCEDFIFRRL